MGIIITPFKLIRVIWAISKGPILPSVVFDTVFDTPSLMLHQSMVLSVCPLISNTVSISVGLSNDTY